MRIALYNQMFALNGKSFLSNVLGHWAVHYQPNPKKIWKRINISNTANTIGKSNADIAGVIEVLEGQEEEVKERLKEKGYNFFYLGKGHKTKYSNLYVQELLASRFNCRQINIGAWPVENKLGGGGGLIHVYCFQGKFHLILAHLGLPSMKFYWKQIDFMQKYLKELDGKIILSGDFNLSYESLRKYFNDFNLVSGAVKTCSLTPIMKWFYNKDVDHIFVKGFKESRFGSFKGYSDHKLIWADLV